MEQSPPLWQAMQGASYEALWQDRAKSRRRYAAMMRVIADRMEQEIIRNAGSPLSRYYLEVPSEWLRNHAKLAESND